MRLDQFLQKTLGISRVIARNILKSKKVTVNGVMVKQAKHQLDLEKDRVFYGDELLVYQEYFYWMLNKPEGYVSSHSTEDGKPVYQLLSEYSHVDMHCAGRLDINTTGLILITNDGQWSHRVAHPNRQCFKRYRVTLAHPITEVAIKQLETGVMLTNEKAQTLPANVSLITPTEITLEICEGKFHQVKRMLHAVGNEVIVLHRDKIGHIELENLPEGKYRALTEEEIEGFYHE